MNPPPANANDPDALMRPRSLAERRRAREMAKQDLYDPGGHPDSPIPEILTSSPRGWTYKIKLGIRIWTTPHCNWYGEYVAVDVERRIRQTEGTDTPWAPPNWKPLQPLQEEEHHGFVREASRGKEVDPQKREVEEKLPNAESQGEDSQDPEAEPRLF